ncbi:MAG TPA: DUF6221 family protein [Mycobacteriales bacterium]|jgi:hypothetical protein|nr:DUF6221 family protein [Mycobacteriales bacterium]
MSKEIFFGDYDSGAPYDVPPHQLPDFIEPGDITDDALALFLLERFEEEGEILGPAGITGWYQPHRKAMTIVDGHREKVAEFGQYDSARHGAYWNPVRVMYSLEGRQAILGAYLLEPHNTPTKKTLHFACRALAAAYAYHDSYDPDWSLKSAGDE